MSSAIEVLKCMIEDRKCFCGCSLENSADTEINALDEAIVALQQKESDKGWVCDVCDRETASCLSLCPDCNDRKQGALEELKKIYKDIDVLWSRVNLDLMTASKIKDILYNRIEELEEGVEQK